MVDVWAWLVAIDTLIQPTKAPIHAHTSIIHVQLREGPLPAVRPRADLHQAGLVLLVQPHDFGVGRAIFDAQRVEALLFVGLGLSRIEWGCAGMGGDVEGGYSRAHTYTRSDY